MTKENLDPEYMRLAVAAAVIVLVYFAAIGVRGALISALSFAILYGIAIFLPWEVNGEPSPRIGLPIVGFANTVTAW